LANRDFRRLSKPWLILGLFLAGWWLIPTVVKSFVQTSFYEFQAPLWSVYSKAKDLQKYWALRNHSKKALIESSRDLSRLNASYELALSQNTVLKEELEHLETLLTFPKIPEHAITFARISRRDLSSWSHFATIQKGSADGITEGAAVIYRKGVIGRVKKVYTHNAIIELASSPTFRVAARFIGDRRPITFQGMSNAAFTTPSGRAYNIPTDVKLSSEKPLKLVSSKLGGVFPDGLPIGTATTLEPGTDGLFKSAHVELPNDLHSIQEVAVLLPLSR